jgi:hypothetical protein
VGDWLCIDPVEGCGPGQFLKERVSWIDVPPVGERDVLDSKHRGERGARARGPRAWLMVFARSPPMKRVSVGIPYFRRLGNLERALRALAEQDLPREEFEVVIGSLEHSVELTALLQRFAAQLDVRCICAAEPWNVARARNLALRAVEGEIVQLLDADMLLPRG